MKIKDLILGLIIAVVFLMFAVYGTNLLYQAPEYDDYCDESTRPIASPIDKEIINETELQEFETQQKDCYDEFDAAREPYSKNLFILTLIFSILIIVISILFIHVESVSGGLMLGSLFFLIYGTGSYWRYMDDLIRFLILGLALGVLIYTGYWLAKKKR